VLDSTIVPHQKVANASFVAVHVLRLRHLRKQEGATKLLRSPTFAKTIEIVRVSRWRAAVAGVPFFICSKAACEEPASIDTAAISSFFQRGGPQKHVCVRIQKNCNRMDAPIFLGRWPLDELSGFRQRNVSCVGSSIRRFRGVSPARQQNCPKQAREIFMSTPRTPD
jgi:hypothetical protein